MKILFFLLFSSSFQPMAFSDEKLIRIEVGDRNNSSERELRERIWRLERAVDQLQQKVYQLQDENNRTAAEWVCTVTALGSTYTGLGGSKAVAKANAIRNCKKVKGENTIFCDDPKCEK